MTYVVNGISFSGDCVNVLPLLYPLYVAVHEEDWCIKLPVPAPRAIANWSSNWKKGVPCHVAVAFPVAKVRF